MQFGRRESNKGLNQHVVDWVLELETSQVFRFSIFVACFALVGWLLCDCVSEINLLPLVYSWPRLLLNEKYMWNESMLVWWLKLFIFMLIIEVGSQSFVVLKKMRAEFKSQSPNVCQWYRGFPLFKSSCLPSLIWFQDWNIVMFSEILILIVVSKSTKSCGFFFFFLFVSGMHLNCTWVHLYCKIQYACWEELIFYVSVAAAVTDA